jgi:RNA polymerase sigma-70 factor (ECF subfamily)
MTSRHAQQLVQHIPRLRRYARALLKDTERAEDLVQETLTRALGKLNFWRRGSDMRAWLFSIMHNQHVNDCRRAQRRPDSLSLHEDRAQEPRAGSHAEQRAHLQDIELALQRLPEEQRAVLLLVSLEGLSYRQTAKVLGIKTGTVMSRLHRARERLRGWLNEVPEAPVQSIRSVK